MKIIKVVSINGDYGALDFEDKYNGIKVIDFINQYMKDSKSIDITLDYNEINVTVHEIDISEEALNWVKYNLQDYDDSKHENVYHENEIINK